jgi:ribokinase
MGMGEITVVGSINIDLTALTTHYPKRGETIFGKRMEVLPGGKGGNQATASARLGKSVTMIGSIGRDLYGDMILESLNKDQIDTRFVKRVKENSTGCAIITIDELAENTMLVLKGANDDLTVKDIENAFSKIDNSKVLLVQMEIPKDAVIESMKQARKKGMFVILDPAPAEGISVQALEYADLITPNRQETKHLTGIDVTDVDSALMAAKYFESIGVKNSIIKMADQGSLVYQSGTSEFVPAVPVKAVDTVGAGDSFAGALGVAIADGVDLVSAVKFASIVGAIKVTRVGAQAGIPTLSEVNRFCEERKLSYYKLEKSPLSHK